MFRKLKKKWKQAYVRLLKSPGAPKEIAHGMGLGLFIAMLPIMGLQMPIAVGVAEIIRRITGLRLSRIAAAAGVWLTNPVTFLPIYMVCYYVGRPFTGWLFPSASGAEAMPSVANAEAVISGSEISWGSLAGDGQPVVLKVIVALIIGGVILGIPIALAGYRITLAIVERYQARAARRQRLREAQAVAEIARAG